jgi:hypothetical protein
MLEDESFEDIDQVEEKAIARELYAKVASKFPKEPPSDESEEVITYAVPFHLVQNTLQAPHFTKLQSFLILERTFHGSLSEILPVYSISMIGLSNPFAKNKLIDVTLMQATETDLPLMFKNHTADSEDHELDLIPTEATLQDLKGFRGILQSVFTVGKRVPSP